MDRFRFIVQSSVTIPVQCINLSSQMQTLAMYDYMLWDQFATRTNGLYVANRVRFNEMVSVIEFVIIKQ